MAPPQRSHAMKREDVESLLGPLKALSELLARSGTEGIIVGGVAASLIGRPRYTADVDAVVLLNEEGIENFLKDAAACGLLPRISDAIRFARQNRVLLLRHLASGIGVDISIGMLPFEREAVKHAYTFNTGEFSIRIPMPEDLIIMKAVAHRPRDIEDIRSIIANHPDLDVARVRKVVREFAAALGMPKLWNDIAGLFKAKGVKTRPKSKKGKK